MTEPKTPAAKATKDADAKVADGQLVDLADDDFTKMLDTYLSGQDTIEIQDPEATVAEIIGRILQAETVADVFNRQQVVPLRDLMGRQLTVTSVRWGRSTFDAGEPFYAIVNVSDPATGEMLVCSCGGRQVLAQLYQLRKLDAFPVPVIVDQSARPTAQGYYPMWLSPAPVAEADF